MSEELRDDEIFAAADRVFASGQNVTPVRVLRLLGRGNPVHIGALLDTWWGDLIQERTYPAEFAAALNKLWELALWHSRQRADQELESERQSWKNRMRLMANCHQSLEQTLLKERRAALKERLHFRRNYRLLRESQQRLRQSLKMAESAKSQVDRDLKRMQLQLSLIRTLSAKRERHYLDEVLALQTLCGSDSAVRLSDQTAANFHHNQSGQEQDFKTLVALAKCNLEQQIDGVRQQLDWVNSATPATERQKNFASYAPQVLAIRHQLEELHRLANFYRTAVEDLDKRFVPLYWVPLDPP